MTSGARDSLVGAIAAREARLVEIDREREETRLHLERLRSELVALDAAAADRATTSHSSGIAPSMTSAKKVLLFRTLFRGRDDLYPKLWENARTGKKGYAPACANEWVQGVCEKPRVRCGECPNQAFVAVSEQTIVDHLQGRHVVGVYPLLPDETCWFLAVDFDKRSWIDDVAVFIETCRDSKQADRPSHSPNGRIISSISRRNCVPPHGISWSSGVGWALNRG